MPATYRWPMVEGLSNLVRVRRRQDVGVRQIAARWPEAMANEGKARWDRTDLAATALRDPVGVAIYGWVHLATRLRLRDRAEAGGAGGAWTRGR